MDIDTDSEMLDDGDDTGEEAIEVDDEYDEFDEEDEEVFSYYIKNLKLGRSHGS